jgi:hypothetical protein
MNAPLRTPLAGPSAARERLCREAVAEYAAILESLSASLGEAAFRGADPLIELHTKQIIATIKATAATVRELRGARQ